MFRRAKKSIGFMVEDSGRKGTVAKQLGIDVSALIHEFLYTKDGVLDVTLHRLFWHAIANDDFELDRYLQMLLMQVLNFLSGKKKFSVDVQTVMNTISFLTLRLQLPMSSEAIVKMVQKYHKSKKFESKNDSIKLVFSILYQRLIDKTQALSSLVIQCHQFYSAEELHRISDYHNFPTIFDIYGGTDKIVSASCENAFTWNYLKSICNDSDTFKKLLLEIDIKLKATAGVVFVDPKLAELSLLSLIFMVNYLISYWRLPDPMFVSVAISTCKRFFLWPVPYGTTVRDFLLRMSAEKVSPGISNLQMIWKESRLPEIIIREDLDAPPKKTAGLTLASSASSSASTDTSPDYKLYGGDDSEEQRFRPLYYLLDRDDPKALLWGNLLHVEDIELWSAARCYEVHSGLSGRTSALLIVYLFSNEIDIPLELIEALRQFHEEDAHEWYGKVIAVYTKASSMADAKSASKYRKLEFDRLCAQIIEASICMVYTDACVDLSELPEDLSNCAPQLIPTIKHTSIICDLSCEEHPLRGAIATGDVTFPANEVLKKIVNLLSNFASIASNEDPITIRLVIGGGNKLLNAVACAYASLFRYYEGLLKLFKLEFLVVPLNSNNYCDWLAREDPWYNRHIYLPFTSPQFVVPSARFAAERPRRTLSGEVSCVGDYYRNMVEDYSRESDHFVRAFLWEVHAWTEDKMGSTPNYVLPFCQRIEIGRRAEYRGFKAMFAAGELEDDDGVDEKSAEMVQMSSVRSADAADTKCDEYDESEARFEFIPQTVTIDWQNVDLIGNPVREVLTQNEQNFESLTVSVCPRYKDPHSPPNPCDEGTCVLNTALNTKVERKRKKGAVTYNLLKTEPCQRIRTMTVTAKDGEEKLWVLIDDRLYGPYAKIRVAPMVNPFDKRQVFLPICSFFPVDSIVS